MVKTRISEAGFSLIELMIVMVIAGILVMAAVPFTQTWMDETRVINGKNALVQAWSQAKALALRNPEAQQGLQSAAQLSIIDEKLVVCVTTCDTTTLLTAWSIVIPKGVTVEFKDPAATSIEFSNTGAVVHVVSGVTVEVAKVTYKVSKGAVADEQILY